MLRSSPAPLRSIDLLCDLLLRLSDHASQISARDVRLDDNSPLNLLAIDKIRAILESDFSNLTERDFDSVVAVDEHSFHRLSVTAGGLD